jgi:hypothetical protein
MFVGVAGDSVLPAVPDDVEPGAGEDADRVGVVVPLGDGVPVNWCKSCGDSPESLRLSTMRRSGWEGIGIGRRNFSVELIVARLVSEESLTVRHCGHRCAGPFRSRNLIA